MTTKNSVFEDLRIAAESLNENHARTISAEITLEKKHYNKSIEGYTLLPKGHGKDLHDKVAIFTDKVYEQKNSPAFEGCVFFSVDDIDAVLAAKKYKKWDVVLCTPKLLKDLSKHMGRVLGGRGLFPHANYYTIHDAIDVVIGDIKHKRIAWRADKQMIIRAIIGKSTLSNSHLLENLKALIYSVQSSSVLTPQNIKGVKISCDQVKGSFKFIET